MRQVNSLKHLYEEIETFKQPSAWTKVKSLVGKLGQPKSATQMKNELRNLKDFYKQAKDNNKRTGASPRYRTFYQKFYNILGTRNVLNLQYITQVVGKDAVLDLPKHSHGCPVVHTTGV